MKNVKSGDPVKLTAKQVNEWNKTAEAYRAGEFQSFENIPANSHNPVVISIQNKTGEFAGMFSVLALGESVNLTGTDIDKAMSDGINKNVAFDGHRPQGSGETVCITLNAVNPDALASAVIIGATGCVVNVMDTSHRYAITIGGDVTKLQSSKSGVIRILNPVKETGEQFCYVLLGGGNALSDELTVPILSPARQWTHKMPIDGEENKLLWCPSDDPFYSYGTWFMHACGLTNEGTMPLPVMEVISTTIHKESGEAETQILLQQKEHNNQPLYYRDVKIMVEEQYAQPGDSGVIVRGDMNKKMTRRAVLGTAIAGLVAAPLVVRGFRNKRSQEWIEKTAFDHAYGKLNIPLDQIDSDLPIAERAKALEIFEKNRASWLSFRGVEGDVLLENKSLLTGQETNESGFIRLRFDLRMPSESRQGEWALHGTQMSFSKAKGTEPLFEIEWKGSSSEQPEIFGMEVGEKFGLFKAYQLLVFPTVVFSALSNEHFTGLLLRLMRLSGDMDNQGSFEFGTNMALSTDGLLVPTLIFTENLFSGYIPKRQPNSPYPKSTLSDVELSGGFLFPKKFELKPVANGGNLTNSQNEEFTCAFVNSTVFTT